MQALGLLVALFMMSVGTAGVLRPDSLMNVGRLIVTPAGLYAVAVVRIGIGLVLILVAPISRAPRTIRGLGAVVIVAGIATPLFGVERSRAILDYEATHGTALVRAAAGMVLAIGGFVAFAVAGRRHPA